MLPNTFLNPEKIKAKNKFHFSLFIHSGFHIQENYSTQNHTQDILILFFHIFFKFNFNSNITHPAVLTRVMVALPCQYFSISLIFSYQHVGLTCHNSPKNTLPNFL